MVATSCVRYLFVALGILGANHAHAFACTNANAIFVDAANGNDGNAGDMANPKLTISGGIASAAGKSVCVATGTYNETVTMVSGVSVYGQYDSANGWVHSTSAVSQLTGGATAVLFDTIFGETHFEWFHINAANAPIGSSSYGIRVINSPGPVYVRYNTLSSGTGGAGNPGGDGTDMGTANSGNNGSAGVCDSKTPVGGGTGGTSSCGGTGGTGGGGGQGPQNGGNGASGIGSAAGSGGSGGGFGDPGGLGSSGLPGGAGLAGSNAPSAASPVGAVFAGLYSPPVAGTATNGTAGSGGGGGGGGGGQDSFFAIDGTGNGGGGGGAGGCGGGAASSGSGGGGSFAIFAHNSTATIDANALVSGAGGTGGTAGQGGSGGAGGSRGFGGTTCSAEVGKGGNGASGGNGGNGGNGAGGNGGPEIAIFGTDAPTLTIGTNRYTLSAPASAGGTSLTNNGLGGVVLNGYPNNIADPGPATLDIADTSILIGYTGSSALILPVTLGPITYAQVSVHYQTQDGTAAAGTNYVATSGDLFFDSWATTQYIRVPILGAASSPLAFTVQLSSPGGAVLGHSPSTVTINYSSDVIFRNSYE